MKTATRSRCSFPSTALLAAALVWAGCGVLAADGAPLATIPAGALAMPAAFGPGGLAAWIERDELDVPFVRVARLSGPG